MKVIVALAVLAGLLTAPVADRPDEPWQRIGTVVLKQPEVLCGVRKPALADVQGPRLPGTVLYPTWPPAGCNE